MRSDAAGPEPMPEPLDRAALDDLRAVTGGDAGLYAELLDAFVTDADLYLSELSSASDPATLARAAHSLKSNAMNVGATDLAELTRSLEADARAGAVPDAETRVAAVRDELAVVRDAVARERHGA